MVNNTPNISHQVHYQYIHVVSVLKEAIVVAAILIENFEKRQ